MRRLLPAILVTGALAALEPAAWAQGCALCRTALESSPEGRFLASSFAHGILFLLFLPYAILGAISFGVFRAYRKKLKEREEHPHEA